MMNLSYIKGYHVGLPVNIYINEDSELPNCSKRLWFQTNYDNEGTITDIWSMNLQGVPDDGYEGLVKSEDIDKISKFVRDNRLSLISVMNGEIDLIDFVEMIS